jgi:hypothetical protein
LKFELEIFQDEKSRKSRPVRRRRALTPLWYLKSQLEKMKIAQIKTIRVNTHAVSREWFPLCGLTYRSP